MNPFKWLLNKVLPVPKPGPWERHRMCTTRTCSTWYRTEYAYICYDVCSGCGGSDGRHADVTNVIRRKRYSARFDWHWERRLNVERTG